MPIGKEVGDPMTLNKDATIVELVARLELDQRGWVIEDHWDGDLCAIGIATPQAPRRLVYISTYNEPSCHYYYECEIPAGPCIEEYRTVAAGNVLSFDELVRIMQWHLDGPGEAQDASRE